MRKTRGPGKRMKAEPADADPAGKRIKLELRDGFVPAPCRGLHSGQDFGHNECKTFEESMHCAVDFTLVPSPASGGSGFVHDNGTVTIISTEEPTGPCGGIPSRSRHSCIDYFLLTASRDGVSNACGLKLTLKLFDLITTMIFDPEEVCASLPITSTRSMWRPLTAHA